MSDPSPLPGARITMTLAYQPPFDWPAMLAFFKARAVPGVETVDNGVFRRTVRVKAARGVISIAHAGRGNSLRVSAVLDGSLDRKEIVARVRRMFDLDADMAAIHGVLGADPVLAGLVRKRPGLRLPGAWDPFEIAVRAVVGQQVSVKGARTIAGRIAAKAGPPFDWPDDPRLSCFFPNPQELSHCHLDGIGMPAKRAGTIRELARAVASGQLSLGAVTSLKNFVEQLTRMPGIGDWTAQYIAMRALGEPDAFPASDLGIAKSLQQGDTRPTPARIRKWAETWRPWRSYAAVVLWHALGG